MCKECILLLIEKMYDFNVNIEESDDSDSYYSMYVVLLNFFLF